MTMEHFQASSLIRHKGRRRAFQINRITVTHNTKLRTRFTMAIVLRRPSTPFHRPTTGNLFILHQRRTTIQGVSHQQRRHRTSQLALRWHLSIHRVRTSIITRQRFSRTSFHHIRLPRGHPQAQQFRRYRNTSRIRHFRKRFRRTTRIQTSMRILNTPVATNQTHMTVNRGTTRFDLTGELMGQHVQTQMLTHRFTFNRRRQIFRQRRRH